MGVKEIGSSVLAASVTSIGSMVVLLFCTVHTFFVIGTIVAMTVLFAIVFSLGSFVAALMLFGPQGHSGNISHYLKRYLFCQDMTEDLKEEEHEKEVYQHKI